MCVGERAQQELKYELGCPAFPTEGTTDPTAEIRFTAQALLDLFTALGESFVGCSLTMTLGADRQWKNEVDFDEG